MKFESPLDVSWSNFINALGSSFTVIVVSEIGDKTFFIAAILAMKLARLPVFLGAILALIFMTIVSVVFGWLVSAVPSSIVYYASTALFVIFGLKMLWDGWHMPSYAAAQEMERVEEDLQNHDNLRIFVIENGSSVNGPQVNTAETSINGADLETAAPSTNDTNQQTTQTNQQINNETATGTTTESVHGKKHNMKMWLRVVLQAFSLIFVSEWGDRSQVTTMVLATKEDIYGVMAGGVLGHSLCTGLAVIGGYLIASKISVRTVTIIGGIVFILFAVYALIFRSPDNP